MNYLKSYKARDFSQGKSARIFKECYEQNIPIKVIRNSEDYVIILPFNKYIELLQEKEESNGK